MKCTIMVPREIEVDGIYCAETCPQHGGAIDACCEFKGEDGCSQILDREHVRHGRWMRCEECIAAHSARITSGTVNPPGEGKP